MAVDEPRVRAAVPADEPAVMALCRRVWPESDHVPWYWARQLKEPGIVSLVVEVSGEVAAIASLDVRGGAGWMQDVRVDPACRRFGLASRLLHAFVEECRRRDLPWIRYASTLDNRAMHAFAGHHGFRPLGVHRYVRAPALTDGVGAECGVVTLGAGAMADAARMLRSSRGWRAGYHAYCGLWTWYDLTDEALQEMLGQDTVYAVLEDGRLDGIAITNQDRDPDYRWLFLARVEGSVRGIEALGRHLRRLVPSLGPACEEVQGMVLDDPSTSAALLRAGYAFDSDGDMRVFELAL